MTHYDIVDLDGTLVRVNTFPRWIVHLVSSAVLSGRLRRAAQLITLVVRRKVGLLSHRDLKHRLVELSSTPDERSRFAQRIAATASCPEVIDMVSASTNTRILATAAAPDYVQDLVDSLGIKFDHVLTSGVFDGEFVDNVGAVKARRVREVVEAAGDSSVLHVFTDHDDDLPLVRLASTVTACNAQPSTVASFRAATSSVLIVENGPRPSAHRLQHVDLSDSESFEAACRQLALLVEDRAISPDLIVGIATGGAHVAEHVGRHLQVPLAIAKAQRPSTKAKSGPLTRVIASIPTRIAWFVRDVESHVREAKFSFSDKQQTRRVSLIGDDAEALITHASRVLVVDDAVDTGLTMIAVRDRIQELAPHATITCASLTVSFLAPLVRPAVVLHDRALLRGPWSLDA